MRRDDPYEAATARLATRGVVENGVAAYDKTQRLLVTMRRDGQIDYDRIVDRTRAVHRLAGWDGAAHVLEAAQRQYRRDLWADQATVVMVGLEKDALEGVFAEVCDEFGAQLWTTHGFASEGFLFEWANEINTITKRGQEVQILYFGDFDPSGLAIEHDARTKLRSHGVRAGWRRCGLYETDLDDFELVRLPVKRTDSRAAGFIRCFGDECAAELDALPPGELRRRVRQHLELHIDRDAWERLKRTGDAERESLRLVANNWDRALEAARGAA